MSSPFFITEHSVNQSLYHHDKGFFYERKLNLIKQCFGELHPESK
jgi:hypothetical protein